MTYTVRRSGGMLAISFIASGGLMGAIFLFVHFMMGDRSPLTGWVWLIWVLTIGLSVWTWYVYRRSGTRLEIYRDGTEGPVKIRVRGADGNDETISGPFHVQAFSFRMNMGRGGRTIEIYTRVYQNDGKKVIILHHTLGSMHGVPPGFRELTLDTSLNMAHQIPGMEGEITPVWKEAFDTSDIESIRGFLSNYAAQVW